MMAPPPPPPPPPDGWQPARPTSGKAIASLVLGLVGIVGVFCYLPVVGAFIGIFLGVAGIVESGKEGKRAGRGLAIAGTACCILAVIGTAAIISTQVLLLDRSGQESEQVRQARLAQDQELIVSRLQEYCVANEGSLGPGGPVLAQGNTTYPAGTAPAGNAPVSSDLRVTGKLELSHLVAGNELKYGGSGKRSGRGQWELIIKGQSSATIRARGWEGEILRELEIRDAAKGVAVQTVP